MDDYARLHKNPMNLLIHVVTVPLFLLAAGVALLCPWLPRWEMWWGGSVALAFYAVFLQRFGHRLEGERGPRRGFGAGIAGFLVEQFATFPRFVISGGWLRNWQGARRGPRELPRSAPKSPGTMQ